MTDNAIIAAMAVALGGDNPRGKHYSYKEQCDGEHTLAEERWKQKQSEAQAALRAALETAGIGEQQVQWALEHSHSSPHLLSEPERSLCCMIRAAYGTEGK